MTRRATTTKWEARSPKTSWRDLDKPWLMSSVLRTAHPFATPPDDLRYKSFPIRRQLNIEHSLRWNPQLRCSVCVSKATRAKNEPQSLTLFAKPAEIVPSDHVAEQIRAPRHRKARIT